MHIEQLFHMVLLISCLEVRFVQYTVEVAYTGSPFLFFINLYYYNNYFAGEKPWRNESTEGADALVEVPKLHSIPTNSAFTHINY